MQHDAIAAAADGMAKADRTAIDIEFCRIDLASGAVEAQNLAAEFFSFQAARQPSTCVANASFNSQVSTSCKVSWLRFRSSVADSTGPRPMMLGSSADHWLSRIAAFGVRPCFATASSEARITHEAPSVICDELPAVTWPHGRSNTGFSFARFSTEESGRTPSS